MGKLFATYFQMLTRLLDFFDQTSLIFQTTEYDTFDPFKEQFLLGIKTVDKVRSRLSFCERVGIRFLDAVWPRSNEKMTDYLAPSLVGLFKN